MTSGSTGQKDGSGGKNPSANGGGVDIHESTDVVCCGCRPTSRRRFRRIRVGTRRKFHDTSQDTGGLDILRKPMNTDPEEDELFFFDACEYPLRDDEYPYISITDYIRPKRQVSMDDPSSMLQACKRFPRSDERHHHKSHDTLLRPDSDDDESLIHLPDRKLVSEPIQNHKARSQRLLTLSSRSMEEQQDILQRPRIYVSQKGFPGDLTVAELFECKKFLLGLKKLDPAVSEQVYSYRDIEEEPYTICRWLRATKFDAAAILQRLKENQPQFEAARDQDFFPDVSATIGAPFSVFLSQFPFLPVGRGKNGCPVNYFQAGKINPEGILSMSTPERLEGYFWWSFMWKFKQEIRKAQARDSDFVRVEGINIIDLHGLSSDALSSETLDIIKLSSKISDFFPETLHCMLIMNAPAFFSMSWGLIRKFIDPRTAQRIQVFSNTTKAMAALRKLVEEDEIPVDYGGTNISIKEAFVREASDPLLKRQEIEVLYVKRKGKTTFPRELTLNTNECMEIRVFTRSSSGASVSVKVGNKLIGKVNAKCTWAQSDDGTSTLLPQSTSVVSTLEGPGKVVIEMEDLDDTPSDRKAKLPRGYFLVVCNVRSKEG